jgi:uncharacterized protein with HEPN domain
MGLDARTYLFDMCEACERLMRFTAKRTFIDYSEDDLLQSAVERQFEILGEALAQLHKCQPKLAQQITDYRRVIDFRNLLIHGYAKVSNAVVWGIVEGDLARLCAEVDALLQQMEKES